MASLIPLCIESTGFAGIYKQPINTYLADSTEDHNDKSRFCKLKIQAPPRKLLVLRIKKKGPPNQQVVLKVSIY